MTSAKSGSVSVSPMHSMMIAIIVEMCAASGVNVSGVTSARLAPITINAGEGKR